MTADLLPDMTPDEYEALKQDIKDNGVIVPVVVDADTGELIDGRHRSRATRELGVDCPKELRRFEDGRARLIYVISTNVHRRSLSKQQRDDILDRLEDEDISQREIARVTGTTRDIVQKRQRSRRGGAPKAPIASSTSDNDDSFSKCALCGNRFKPKPRRGGQKTRFCSTACSGKASRTPKPNCLWCGQPTRTAHSKHCSKRCAAKAIHSPYNSATEQLAIEAEGHLSYAADTLANHLRPGDVDDRYLVLLTERGAAVSKALRAFEKELQHRKEVKTDEAQSNHDSGVAAVG